MSSHFTNLLGQGIEAFQEGKYESATTKLKMILQLDGKNLPALHILGLILAAQKDFTGASNYLNKAAQINPNDPSLQYNLAKALMDAGLNKESLRHHKKATELAPRNREAWLNYGKASSSLGQFTEGLLHYEKAIQIDPNYVEAIVSKGAALKDLGRYTEAVECADKAISLNPHEVSAWSNKGVALRALKLHEEAIRQFNKLLELDPCYADGWFNRGSVLNEIKLYSEAIEDYKKAYELNENINWLFGEYIHAKMKICDWSDFDNSLDQISKKTVMGAKAAHPFTLLSLTDNPDLLKRSSEIFSKNNYSAAPSLAHNKKLAKKSKLRIGYFSADFRIHPVAFLIAELFELHDKNQFEVYAFSFVDSADEMNTRIRNAVHSFINVSDKSDFEISQLARDLSIDIAIDLSGFTERSRTKIFSYRAAPIQVNFLGYPGTMGSDFIDYIIADRVLISDCLKDFYTEKVIALPNSYQPNDRKRQISKIHLTKIEMGLPLSGFIFCCFCNNYKITPATFDCWMRILKSVDGSVLWLFEDNATASENLKLEAQKRGVDPSRLIFAKSMTQSDHLARYRLADIFLDTFPYNAHTTASDALWSGLPIITLMGQSFASRVASSLLSAIGLKELITTTHQEYENFAIHLARNSEKILALKKVLANNILSTPLFDSILYTKHIEFAYRRIYENHDANSKAEHLSVA